MDKDLTPLTRGVFVTIKEKDLDILYSLRKPYGFLERKNYPDFYEKIALENEIGRYHVFRFLLEKDQDETK